MIPKHSYRLYAISILSLIGLSISAFMTQHYYDLHNGTAGFRSFCNLSKNMNCDIVTLSPFAVVAAGIPLASFAVGGFLSLFVLSLITYANSWRKEGIKALFFFSTLASFICLFYIGVMAIYIKTFCILCLTIDVLVFSLLILTWSLNSEKLKIRPIDFSKWKVFSGLVLSSFVVSTVLLNSLANDSNSKEEALLIANSILSNPRVSVKTDPSLPSIGNVNAPMTIVEFSDFQCPYCRLGAINVNSLMNRFPNQVRMIFRNFPLNQNCNSMVQSVVHPAACEAARIAVCGFKQGKFQTVYETLFDNQSSLAVGGTLNLILQKIPSLNETQFRSCEASSETTMAIYRDVEDARNLGIKSTPTFFVNGLKVEGALPLSVWEILIEKMLDQKS